MEEIQEDVTTTEEEETAVFLTPEEVIAFRLKIPLEEVRREVIHLEEARQEVLLQGEVPTVLQDVLQEDSIKTQVLSSALRYLILKYSTTKNLI